MESQPNQPSPNQGVQKRIDRLVNSPMFPLDDNRQLKALSDSISAEKPRMGEGGVDCATCVGDHVLWSRGRWQISSTFPSALPVGLFLETADHLDFEDLYDAMAAEYGLISRHLEAAIRQLPAVGRVHIHRWGDGAEHFHVWFQGRPAGHEEFLGFGAILWSLVLPPLPTSEIESNHAEVLATFDASIDAIDLAE